MATETGERCFTGPMITLVRRVLYFYIKLTARVYYFLNYLSKKKYVQNFISYVRILLKPMWSIGQVKQRSQVSVATAYKGMCGQHNAQPPYLSPTNVRYPSELGRLRDTLQTREQILAFTRIRTRDLWIASRARCRSATVPHFCNVLLGKVCLCQGLLLNKACC